MKILCTVSDCMFKDDDDGCSLKAVHVGEKDEYNSIPTCKSYKIKDGVTPKCPKCGSRAFFCGCI